MVNKYAAKIHVLDYLVINYLKNNEINLSVFLLELAYNLEPQNLDTNYNLAYVLNMMGKSRLALDYLSNLNNTDESIEQLKKVLKEYFMNNKIIAFITCVNDDVIYRECERYIHAL